MQNEPNNTVQSLERAMLLLEKLAVAPDGLSLKELSLQADLHKSTVHRMLHTFKILGYVYQSPETDCYFIGSKILTLSSGLLANLDVRTVARPFLKELCDTTGEDVQLSILSNAGAVFIDKIENLTRAFRMYSQIGKCIPLYCSASGKALVAWRPEQHVRDMLAHTTFNKYTTHTLSCLEDLLEELQQVRVHGFAVDWFEHESSIYCVAAPIFDGNGNVIAAISIAGTILDLSVERFTDFSSKINFSARQISERMGCTQYPAVYKPRQIEWNNLLHPSVE